MTDQEINIAIAEACPTIFKHDGRIVYYRFDHQRAGQAVDPCNDLNAMHEAEQTLQSDNNRLHPDDGEESDWDCYIYNLEEIVSLTCAEDDIYRNTINAAARPRAEAFLRTIGKRQDG